MAMPTLWVGTAVEPHSGRRMINMENYRVIYVTNCLQIDPFEGDFGSGDERKFSDKLIVARKDHECHICAKEIPEGILHRALTDKSEGKVATSRYCYSCCVAQAVSFQTGDTELLESRSAKRSRAAQRRE